MIENILNIIFLVLGIIAFVIANGYFWTWFYSCPTSQDETSYFRTADGWRLALHRYRPQGTPRGVPVILCHGLGANRYAFDLGGAPSLAPFLAQRGRDIWVAELRGSGMSDHPGLCYSDVPYRWGFEDHFRVDLPAIIDHVLEKTGATAVHWVGHSMGGMIIQAHLAERQNPPVASAVSIGSPTKLTTVPMTGLKLMARMKWTMKLILVPPMPFIGRLIIPVAHRLPTSLLGVFHPLNIAPRIARKVIALGSELVMSSTLWHDFGRFLTSGILGSKDGRPYLLGLADSRVPILALGGSKDRMVSPEAITAELDGDRAQGERKCLILGKSGGCAEDYGHMDLLIGIRAEEEVFPILMKWLEDHDPLPEPTV